MLRLMGGRPVDDVDELRRLDVSDDVGQILVPGYGSGRGQNHGGCALRSGRDVLHV